MKLSTEEQKKHRDEFISNIDKLKNANIYAFFEAKGLVKGILENKKSEDTKN